MDSTLNDEIRALKEQLVDRYLKFCKENEFDVVEGGPYIEPMDTRGLEALRKLGALPDELVSFLALPSIRIRLGFEGPMQDHIGNLFCWADNAEVVRMSEEVQANNEEHDWEVPPCVVLSSESSEYIAYQLETGQMIHVSAGDDGDVTELGYDLPGLLQRYRDGLKAQLESRTDWA